MTVTRGYKTELDLNNEQRTACLKHAGASRFTYNWGLARSVAEYRVTGKRPTNYSLDSTCWARSYSRVSTSPSLEIYPSPLGKYRAMPSPSPFRGCG